MPGISRHRLRGRERLANKITTPPTSVLVPADLRGTNKDNMSRQEHAWAFKDAMVVVLEWTMWAQGRHQDKQLIPGELSKWRRVSGCDVMFDGLCPVSKHKYGTVRFSTYGGLGECSQ